MIRRERPKTSDESILQLWTVQDARAWERSLQRGHLTGDPDFIDPDWFPAYHWLMGQMAKRLVNYAGEYPVWAWPRRPHFGRGYFDKGVQGVRIGFTAAKESVLLSDYECWHLVLSGNHLSLTRQESVEFDRQQQAARSDHELAALEAECERSWERVFDLAAIRSHAEWCGGVKTVQATVGRVALSDVFSVQPLRRWMW